MEGICGPRGRLQVAVGWSLPEGIQLCSPDWNRADLSAVTSTLSRGMHPAALCTATEREKAFPVSAIKVRDFFESNVFKKKLSQRVGSKDTERNNRFQS